MYIRFKKKNERKDKMKRNLIWNVNLLDEKKKLTKK